MDRRLEHLHQFEDALRPSAAYAAATPEQLALLIAGMAHPNLDIRASLDTIDDLAMQMAVRLQNVSPGYDYAQVMLGVFRTEFGFYAARDDYYAPENSLLDTVLEKRTGLPIMLCLVLVAIGQRTGVDIVGIGLPGHFMARYRGVETSSAEQWLIDPCNGRIITPESASAYLSTLFGQEVPVSAEAYRPYTPAAWARRILNNLRNAYRRADDYAMAAAVLGYMLAMEPTMPQIWLERAELHHLADNPEGAVADLRRYHFLTGQYALVWGDEAARGKVRPLLAAQDKRLFAMYQEDLAAVGRRN